MNNSMLMAGLGWLGTIAYLTGYILLCFGHIKPSQRLYHLLNIIGGLGLIGHAWYLQDTSNILVNGVWAAVAVFALLRGNGMKRSKME
ncbi:CBU_0592 family membrane protein [Flavihumibacter petaseus]|uniref:CBU-0592-like domain-containing protein n=1 Tax=Flavihumibacter petaseus NBRC 106054 TaxID=1220578 RepID=A0A0E9MZ92_9BACT|nr:hypothetical protein [Flavihumibacter petaseus]GAO42706.1 hypothetical protein FPE01S_01_17220 [Flavihumibacter petaseus NBRC 106054]